MRDERSRQATRRIAVTFWTGVTIVLALGMFGCGITEPEPVSISGDWTFQADAPPCTWTLDATFYGTVSGEGNVRGTCSTQDVDGQSQVFQFPTTIVGVLVTDDALAFFEGGCQYLLTLVDPDTFRGVVDCGQFAGDVEGHRGVTDE
jgi:hypothetical protein